VIKNPPLAWVDPRAPQMAVVLSISADDENFDNRSLLDFRFVVRRVSLGRSFCG
jgi:hypothetical protein